METKCGVLMVQLPKHWYLLNFFLVLVYGWILNCNIYHGWMNGTFCMTKLSEKELVILLKTVMD